MVSEAPLWRPSAARIADANLTRFIAAVNARHGLSLGDYDDLQRWSVAHSEDFWCAVWDELGVIAETRGERVVADKEKLPGAAWFPDARLNFAENALRWRGDRPAIMFRNEAGHERVLSWDELHAAVGDEGASSAHVARLARLWEAADETLQARVESARARVEGGGE